MDKNGKIFGKISIVDLLVVILVITLGIGTFYRFTSSDTAVNLTNETIRYTVRIDGVRHFTIENYHEGLRVYNRMTNQFIGTIESVRYEPHMPTAQMLDGTILRLPFPDHITIYIDVVANGRVTDTAIFAEGNNEINAGSLLQMNTKYVMVTGTIHSVSVQ